MRAIRIPSWRTSSLLWTCLLLVSGARFVQAGCLDQVQLTGVNLAGAEFNAGTLPGIVGTNYVYPVRSDLEYFRTAGMNVIRLPFLWERIQPQLNGELDSSELLQIRQIGKWATELGLCVILDLHNYGKYRGATVGSAAVPSGALADLWVRLHREFPQREAYAYGLMNEPAAISVKAWTPIAQEVLNAIREAGSKNLVLVGSGRWSGAHEWEKEFDGTSASREFSGFRDPENTYAIELHQYFDANFSGTGQYCVEPARIARVLDVVSTWARAHGQRVLLGEFGAAGSSACLSTLAAALSGMVDSRTWLGWTYWAAGRWWGSYPFSIQPQGGGDAAQMLVLKKYTKRPKPPGDFSTAGTSP